MDHQVILTFMFLIFLIVVNLKGMQWYHVVIFISLMIHGVEHLFFFLRYIHFILFIYFFILKKFKFIYFNWRLITLQYLFIYSLLLW